MMHYALRYWWCIALGLAIGLWQNWDWIVQQVPDINPTNAAVWALLVLYVLFMVRTALTLYLLLRADLALAGRKRKP